MASQSRSSRRQAPKRALPSTPLASCETASQPKVLSPWGVARDSLHVARVPDMLPGREEAFDAVYSSLEAAIAAESGTCIYISGVPGTGKTATVRDVIRRLRGAVQHKELNDFKFVDINGMKITDPHQAYSILYDALHGKRLSPAHALDLLEHDFAKPNPHRLPCVVLMDELDQLVTKSQSIMYNFFNWPSLTHSRLIVLAVANTMDLPERTLSNKISSRLGLVRISFAGYTFEQLVSIIRSRLTGEANEVFTPDAIEFASRKVAAVSGDARRALDICRRAVEIAESVNDSRSSDEPKSKRVKTCPRPPLDQDGKPRVTIDVVKQAIGEVTSSMTHSQMRGLSVRAKTLVAALSARCQRSGNFECSMAEAIGEATRHCDTARVMNAKSALPATGVTRGASGRWRSCFSQSMVREAITDLSEIGILAVEARRGDRHARVRLRISSDEILAALRSDLEMSKVQAAF